MLFAGYAAVLQIGNELRRESHRTDGKPVRVLPRGRRSASGDPDPSCSPHRNGRHPENPYSLRRRVPYCGFGPNEVIKRRQKGICEYPLRKKIDC